MVLPSLKISHNNPPINIVKSIIVSSTYPQQHLQRVSLARHLRSVRRAGRGGGRQRGGRAARVGGRRRATAHYSVHCTEDFNFKFLAAGGQVFRPYLTNRLPSLFIEKLDHFSYELFFPSLSRG